MNNRKLARLLAKTTVPMQFPAVQVALSASELAGHPLGGGANAPATLGGYACYYVIDPPVGGFALNDRIGLFPDTQSFQTVGATKAEIPSLNFAPGWWDVVFNLQPANSIGQSLAVTFHEFDASKGILGPMGGNQAPFIGTAVRNVAASPLGLFAFRLYSSRPWQAQLFTLSAMTDAQIANASGVFTAHHLLDDFPSAL